MIRAIGLFLLALLKIAGWTLLLAVLILLVVLLLVLFVPIHYEVLALNEQSADPLEKNPVANLQLRLKVTWLLHLVHVTVSYGPPGLSNKIRIAGVDILKLLAKIAARKKAGRKGKKLKRSKKKRFVKKSQAAAAENIPVTETSAREFPTEQNDTSSLLEMKQYHTTASIKSGEEKQKKETKRETEQKEISEAKISDKIEISDQAQIFDQTETSDQANMSEQKETFDQEQISEQKETSDQEQTSDPIEPPDQKKTSKKKKKSDKKKQKQEKRNKKKLQKRSQKRLKAEKPKKKDGFSDGADKAEQGIFRKIRNGYERLRQEYTDEVNRHALGHLWTELLKLLRSYKPKKLQADLSFSLADPSLTGMATGILGMIPLVYRYPCSIQPDFTSEKLYVEGKIQAQGRVMVVICLTGAIRLLRDKEFMYVVRRITKRDRS